MEKTFVLRKNKHLLVNIIIKLTSAFLEYPTRLEITLKAPKLIKFNICGTLNSPITNKKNKHFKRSYSLNK